MSNREQVILCLGCAELLPSAGLGEPCPRCGFQTSSVQYRRLLGYAEHLVRYGYQYRSLYENEMRAGHEERRYYLAPLHEAFSFIGLAILSGVIGNTAQDIIKAVIRRIRRQLTDNSLADSATLQQLEAESGQLAVYIIELATDPGSIDRQVLSAMLDEALVDLTMELRRVRRSLEESAERESSPLSLADDMAAHRAATLEAKNRLPERFLPPDDVDWDELWRNAGG
jgi:hypothetical protein